MKYWHKLQFITLFILTGQFNLHVKHLIKYAREWDDTEFMEFSHSKIFTKLCIRYSYSLLPKFQTYNETVLKY